MASNLGLFLWWYKCWSIWIRCFKTKSILQKTRHWLFIRWRATLVWKRDEPIKTFYLYNKFTTYVKLIFGDICDPCRQYRSCRTGSKNLLQKISSSGSKRLIIQWIIRRFDLATKIDSSLLGRTRIRFEFSSSWMEFDLFIKLGFRAGCMIKNCHLSQQDPTFEADGSRL